MAGNAAASVIATEDVDVAAALQTIFSRGMFRVYTNHDVIGCEIGGALKNVIAIATGMAEGLSTGDNTRAGVITRGLAELSRLGVALGAHPETMSGLAGMGDLIATCISKQSRNRYVGEQLGQGRELQAILEEMGQVAEGVKSAPTVMKTGRAVRPDHADLWRDRRRHRRFDQPGGGLRRPAARRPARTRVRTGLSKTSPARRGWAGHNQQSWNC